ncbi:MAG: hypothetical protein ACOY3P_20135 [Planctomycetota bacterium]
MPTLTPAEQRQIERDFVFPVIRPYAIVEVADDDQFSNPMVGMVSKIRSKSVDIVVIDGADLIFYHNCFHADDPRLQREELRKQIRSDRGRGVFKLHKCEGNGNEDLLRLVSALADRLSGLERTVERMAQSLPAAGAKKKSTGE